MVFVTVGTHEQPFDRLMKAIEDLVASGVLHDVVVQYGYSLIQPKECKCSKFLSYEDMCHYYSAADLVICHGGPSTFLEAISYGKVPVVMPRKAEFGEHVNDHQVSFCHQYSSRVGGILVVDTVQELSSVLMNKKINSSIHFNNNNQEFCRELASMISDLFETKRDDE